MLARLPVRSEPMNSPDYQPTPRELARLCIESAKAHFEASKVLAAAGRSDFATFHLLTSFEEICKSRLVGTAFVQLKAALASDALPISAKTMTKSLFSHSTKIPLGVFMALIQAGPLAAVKHPKLPTGVTPFEVAEIKAQALAQAEWVAKNLEDPEDIRERAIYAGLDRSGVLPPRLDWTEYVQHLSRLIEDQLDFSEYIVQQEMTSEELERARAWVNEWIPRLRARDNTDSASHPGGRSGGTEPGS